MSKADSKKAAFWFVFAALALLLALGGAAAAGFWLIKTSVSRQDDSSIG